MFIIKRAAALFLLLLTLTNTGCQPADPQDPIPESGTVSSASEEKTPDHSGEATGSEEEISPLCALYLQVLEDLWNVDAGLNNEAVCLGLDLTEVTDLTEAEKDQLLRLFEEQRGIEVIATTYEELAASGEIGEEFPVWDRGCLFTIRGSAQEGFDAWKWRSALGAYFFSGCKAQQAADGSWTYTVESQVIA